MSLSDDQQARLDVVLARRDRQVSEETRRMVTAPTKSTPWVECGLSAREAQVLALVAEGLTNSEIAHKLFLAEDTVKSHVRRIIAKLQANSRAHAVAIGFRRAILS